MLAEGGSPLAALVNINLDLLNRGEIDAAESVSSEIVSYAHEEAALRHAWCVANVAFARGNINVALREIRQGIREAEALQSDYNIFRAHAFLVEVTLDGRDAGHFLDADVMATARELEVGSDRLLALTGTEGTPWYPVQVLTLRAQLLAIAADTLPQALALGRRAVDLARSTYADLLPEIGRALADHLLRASVPDEALSVIAEIEPEAVSRGFLNERARLLAGRVLALVQRGDDASTLAPHVASLREALMATDSPRITAETLRDLAERLPPLVTTPDPHALADEALGLFVSMPMPAQEARCLEIMGDVLLARGEQEHAKRRYLTARSRLQRYGLGLRVPLLDREDRSARVTLLVTSSAYRTSPPPTPGSSP